MAFQNAQKVYREFPRTFWTLVAATFMDRLGGSLIFPFLALYVTQKFEVGMTEVGILFGIFSIAGLVGNLVGGALTDRFGRRSLLIFGLVFSSLTALAMGFITDLRMFYLLALVVGTLGDIAGPAHQAMVADLLPESKRAEGYGIIRVGFNLAVVIGPAIGGFLASRSFLSLFILDAVFSLITAGIVFRGIPETRPERAEGEARGSMLETISGYRLVFKDTLFMVFIFISILLVLVYMQMNSSLSVFLRDFRSIPPQGYGWLLSLNAAMVVVMQFWVTRRVSNRPPMLMMTFGMLLYAIGFGMYGFVYSYLMMVLAMVIITIGEMIIAPVSQALVARLAPEEYRGRYMAINGFSWIVPSTFGTLVAGYILDNLDPNWLWYAALIVGLVATAGFFLLHLRAGRRLAEDQPHEAPVPLVEVRGAAAD